MGEHGETDSGVLPGTEVIEVQRAEVVFFFSSRRRHTRFDCDWSSDVCSSDLFHYYIIMKSSDNLKVITAPIFSHTIFKNKDIQILEVAPTKALDYILKQRETKIGRASCRERV